MSKVSLFFNRMIKGPSITHSIIYGLFAGITFYSTYICFRGVKLYISSTEDMAKQSRWRYLEKQQLFARELGTDTSSSYVSNLASEYDPTALRLPGQPFDSKLKI